MHIDTLIHAGWIIPVDDHNTVYENHALAIQDGRILAILPSQEASDQFTASNVCDRRQHALIPGFVNAHTHAAMNLLRGLADDLPLMTWLNDHIWPAEGALMRSEFVLDGTRHAIAEMIRSGTTCFNDMYFFPDQVAHAASRAGIRATVGMIVIDFPSAWAADQAEYFRKGQEVHDAYRQDTLISTCFAPHAPYTVSDDPLKLIATQAEELDVPIHIHLHETAHEVESAVEADKRRPIQRLQQLGLLSPRLLAVHMTQLTENDIELASKYNINIAHCPESNLKLASGICPTHTLTEAGVNVALGTDGAASNNDLDMLGEMRTAALIAKGATGKADAIPAHQALRMATLNGAKALGLENDIGSLDIGKAADVTAIDLHRIETQPIYDPISQIVYASSRDQISDVWVAGKQLLDRRVLTTLDEAHILQKAREWQAQIKDFH